MVASGALVTRTGERKLHPANTVDLFATLAEAVGLQAPDDLDGFSFLPLLSQAGNGRRAFNYSEYISAKVTGWTTRKGPLKLIQFDDGTSELFNVEADHREENNLLLTSEDYTADVEELKNFADEIRQ